MQLNEETEIRFYLIGPPQVGKKSLRKRIQTLPSTQALSIQPSSSCPKQESITQEDRSYIVQKYDIGSTKLFIRLFIIPEAEQIDKDYDPDEDNSDAELAQEYKIIFKTAKKAIKSFMHLPSFSSNNLLIKHVFLFTHDLSNPSSFDQLKIYYSKLAEYLQFKDHTDYIRIFLGNKCEKKAVLDGKQRKTNNDFLSNNALTNYELSIKLWFNFNDFYIILLSHVLNESYTNYNQDKIDKLKALICSKQSFPKAERKWFQIEKSPGPGDYYSNIYRYDSMKEMKDCFVNQSTRFNKKIFVNKIGIVFDKDDVNNKKKEDKRTESNVMFVNSSEINKKLMLNPIGYSLGLKPGKLNLRKNRLEKSRERSAELRRSFEEKVSNLSYNDKLSKINNEDYFDSIQYRKKEFYNSKLSNRKDRLETYSKLQLANNKRIRSVQTKKINAMIKESNKEFDIEKMKQRYKDIIYGNNSVNLKKSEDMIAKSKKRLKINNQGPHMYDIRGSSVNLHKGFSIKGKSHIPIIRDNTTPQLVYLKTDFDVIAEKKNNNKPSFNERFKQLETITINNGETMKEKFKKWNENKKESEGYKAYLDFQEYRKINKINQDFNYQELRKEEQDRNQEILAKSLKANSEGELVPFNEIVYTQVEEKSPCVSSISFYEMLYNSL